LEQVNRGVLNLGIASISLVASVLPFQLGVSIALVYVTFVRLRSRMGPVAVGLMAIGCAAILLLIATQRDLIDSYVRWLR
jgi:hypothetical protein